MTLTAEEKLLTQARNRLPELNELADRTSLRLSAMRNYVREYRQYCWPVNSIDDLKLAPFHLLASEGAMHTDKPHTWHMETLKEFCAADTKLLLATTYRLVDLNDPESCESAIAWWTELRSTGNEGMVVKPAFGFESVTTNQRPSDVSAAKSLMPAP